MRGVWIPAFAGIQKQNSKMTKTSRNLYPGKQMERECLTKREKGETINGALRLARDVDKLTESINLTWIVYW